MYANLIAQAIPVNDPATLTLVEELMRTNLTALDHLSAAEFHALARQCAADAAALHQSGELVGYCDALGLALPAWARRPCEGGSGCHCPVSTPCYPPKS